jgi:hypothetical protein
LVFWLHPTGDILYHRNLKTKRGFFYFLDSYIFFGVSVAPWLVPSHPVKAIQQMNGRQKKFPYGRSGFS